MSEEKEKEKETEIQIKNNVWSELQSKSVTCSQKLQHAFCANTEYAICMFNIQLSGNVGMTMRTACAMGFEKFIICGRHHYDKRFTVGAHNYIDVVYWNEPIKVTITTLSRKLINKNPSDQQQYKETIEYFPEAFITNCQIHGYTPIFIEQGGNDIRTREWKHVSKPMLVLGNESFGIPRDFMRVVCNAIPDAQIISIPQWSVLRSLNIANAATIAMWELRSKNKFEMIV